MIHAVLSNLILLLLVANVAAQPPVGSADAAVKDWVYLQNADVRVGLLRSHGGAIAYLSDSQSNVNTLNHYDHGRLVQQSYYGDRDKSRWVDQPWRYNPIQGGGYRGKPAKVTEFESTRSTAYAKTIPRHWATGELLDECTMEQWVKLQGPVVRVRYQFTYQGKQTHQPRHQETPAVFVTPELSKLVAYTGDAPWTNGMLTEKTPGWPNEQMTLSESWAAYVGPDGVGVGVYVPGVSEATCYRFQGGADSDCSYVAPLRTFALTPNLKFAYTAFFTLGNAKTIRTRFGELHRQQAE